MSKEKTSCNSVYFFQAKEVKRYAALFVLALFQATLVGYALHVHENPGAFSARSLSASSLSKGAGAWTASSNSAKQGHDAASCFLCNFLQRLSANPFVSVASRPFFASFEDCLVALSQSIPSRFLRGGISPRAPPLFS